MTREKLINLSKYLTSDRDNYLSAFHKNMNLYVSQPDFTIREISERSGLSFSTINTVLYGNNRDYKLSTIIGLSKAMNVSIDELVGCSTLDEEERYLIQAYRSSSRQEQLLIHWFVQMQKQLQDCDAPTRQPSVLIMQMRQDETGGLLITNQYQPYQLPDSENKKHQHIFMGVQLPCCDYMPDYSPYDYIMLANDRPPKINEDCIILSAGKCYIVKRIPSDKSDTLRCIDKQGKIYYYPAPEDIMGYIVCTQINEEFYQR